MSQVIANGVQPIASSGNNAQALGPYQDGIADPACYPGTVSVGAVYDSYVGVGGSIQAFNCTDATTTADKITCFSQSAPILSLLAPGAVLVSTAGGPGYQGTSQAAPHVAGAWAVVKASMPNAASADILSALQGTGAAITDARNGVTRSRVNLFHALDSEGPGSAGDGVLFPLDNCVALQNSSQTDADADGCGNNCDGDFNNSGQTTIVDFNTFKACFGRAVGPGGPTDDPTCGESDMNATGAVTIVDFNLSSDEFGSSPPTAGPSGLPSALRHASCFP
jgi:hypothetical protein